MLGLFQKPLVDETFEVWRYGPVVPSVYHCLSQYRGDKVEDFITLHPLDEADFSPQELALISAVFEKYGHMDGLELSSRTHKPGTPWCQSKAKGRWYIPDEMIEEYYYWNDENYIMSASVCLSASMLRRSREIEQGC